MLMKGNDRCSSATVGPVKRAQPTMATTRAARQTSLVVVSWRSPPPNRERAARRRQRARLHAARDEPVGCDGGDGQTRGVDDDVPTTGDGGGRLGTSTQTLEMETPKNTQQQATDGKRLSSTVVVWRSLPAVVVASASRRSPALPPRSRIVHRATQGNASVSANWRAAASSVLAAAAATATDGKRKQSACRREATRQASPSNRHVTTTSSRARFFTSSRSSSSHPPDRQQKQTRNSIRQAKRTRPSTAVNIFQCC